MTVAALHGQLDVTDLFRLSGHVDGMVQAQRPRVLGIRVGKIGMVFYAKRGHLRVPYAAGRPERTKVSVTLRAVAVRNGGESNHTAVLDMAFSAAWFRELVALDKVRTYVRGAIVALRAGIVGHLGKWLCMAQRTVLLEDCVRLGKRAVGKQPSPPPMFRTKGKMPATASKGSQKVRRRRQSRNALGRR